MAKEVIEALQSLVEIGAFFCFFFFFSLRLLGAGLLPLSGCHLWLLCARNVSVRTKVVFYPLFPLSQCRLAVEFINLCPTASK